MVENWRQVVGFEGLYEVSDLGRVRSISGKRAGTVLAHSKTPLGRHKVHLRKLGAPRSTMLVHRLVLFAFVGPPPGGMEGCHNNGNPDNNALVNLRWDTHVNNLADRKQHGTLVLGERHHNNRFTLSQIREMRRLSRDGISQRSIAKHFDTKQPIVSNIVRRLTWAHLPD